MKTAEAIKSGAKNIDKTYGFYKPVNRYNFDQIPLPFCNFKNDTITTKGEVQVVVHGNSNDDKRFATLQLLIRAEGEQPKVTIIFRGQGVRITRQEKNSWDPRVHVMFQKKAWFDRPTSKLWDKEVFARHIEERTDKEGVRPESIAFCDNLDAQTHPDFHAALKSHGTSRYLLKAKETEALQTIDVGIAAISKWLIGDEQDKWLLSNLENVELWEGAISASMRRVLITQWVGAAFERLFRDYKETIFKCFRKCGQLITIDESFDNDILPISGIPYNFPSIWEKHKDSVVESVLSRIISSVLDGLPYAETGEVRQSVEGTYNESHSGEEEKEDLEQVEENNDHDEVDVEVEEDDEEEEEEDEDEDECTDEDDGDIDLSTAAAGSSEPEEHLIDDKESWDQCLVLAQHKYGEVLVVDEIEDTQRVTKRLTGLVIMWFSADDKEWDLMKVDQALSSPGFYRLQSLSSGRWHYNVSLRWAEAYGRTSRSFIFLTSIRSTIFLRA